MSEPTPLPPPPWPGSAAPAAPPAPGNPATPHQAPLDALRAQGADRLEPLRFHYLTLLAQRIAQAPAHRAARLQPRLEQGLLDLQAQVAQARSEAQARLSALEPSAPEAARELARLLAAQDWPALRRQRLARPAAPGSRPLVALTQYLEQASAQVPSDGEVLRRDGLPELKSATRFRPGWTRLRAEQRVSQALAQAPDQAGPFNSQMLLLRSLELLRKLSPAYLEHLVSQVDTLLWLEQASLKAPKATKPGAKVASKPPGKASTSPAKTPRRKAT
ncbi:DUF2894 domain-containing protein [Curvibacter sp. HBC28]|uniref:DUF2894 domain-containing protein n=1 Tax=Curvibacter microcysteis TaxID=3026419 RepID=A0ABT5MJ90_9BURK|nr:DUF2894 domain-containing protein [Curvibacter sp. HBC28]MDD0815265.1 DUF2894 domain-containing protein [Curvibacter sp. HBC28]